MATQSVGNETPTLNLSGRHWGGTILGGVTVPLYDGGVRRAALEGARDRAVAAEAGLERAKLEAARQIVTARNLATDARFNALSAAATLALSVGDLTNLDER